MTDDLTWVVTGIEGNDLLAMAVDEQGTIHRRRYTNCTLQWAEITINNGEPFLAPVMAIANEETSEHET